MLPANFANFLSAALTAGADAQFHNPEHPLPRKRSESRYCLLYTSSDISLSDSKYFFHFFISTLYAQYLFSLSNEPLMQ